MFLKGFRGAVQFRRKLRLRITPVLCVWGSAAPKHQEKVHWGANSGSVYSPEGNVGFECHIETTENQSIILISRLNIWQTIGACFFLLACFSSQIPTGIHLQGWGGSQIFPLRLRCFLASCWYQLLGSGPCFHKDGYKLGIFHKPVGLLSLLMSFFFSSPARLLGRQAPHPFSLTTSAPLHHAGSSCCDIASETRCFYPGGTNCMTPLRIKWPH